MRHPDIPFVAALLVLLVQPAIAQDAASAPSFGFSGLEIYKVDDGTSRLRCVDVNGDKLTDLAVANNRRATIDFFFQKTREEMAASKSQPVEYDNINEIVSDARFRKESFLTEKRIFDVLLEDLNGDDRPDLAYYGDPKELVVVPRAASGWSEERQRFSITEARAFGRGLAAGDLDGNGKTDIALLGAEKTLIFLQGSDGKFAQPTEVPNSQKTFTSLAVADLNGDGRKDLLLVGSGLVEPFSLRLQGPQGLGPEVSVETPAFRSYLVTDVTGDGKPEIVVVQEATGRLVVFGLEEAKPERAIPIGKMRLFPLSVGEESGRQRIALGDVDGDGLVDILEQVHASAQLRLHRQGAKGDWLAPGVFPALAGMSGALVADLDGDDKPEVILLSSDEKAVGVTRWDGERLAFPRSLSLQGKPLSCDAANLDGKKGSELAIAVEEDGKTSILFFSPGDPLTSMGPPLEIEGAKDPPQSVAFFDANQDGLQDLLVSFPYESLRIYLQSKEPGKPLPRFTDVSKEKDFGKGLLQGAVTTSLAGADVNGDGKPEFLLAKKNFARAFRVTPKLEVVDQFNARDPASEVVGATLSDLNGDDQAEVTLLDKARKQLWILARKGQGSFEPACEIKIPEFRYRRLMSLDLNGDGIKDIFVEGEDRFGILYSGGTDWRFKRLAQYETELKDAWLDQVAVGDLNADGVKDLLVSDSRSHLFEILVQRVGQGDLTRRERFKVFETGGATGEDTEDRRREPREINIVDVTGDGKADVVMLIHDRIIVYPQE